MQQRQKQYATIFLFALFIVSSYAQVLDVPEVTQEQNEWCWAGVSSSVLAYYGKPTSQCAIANYARTKATWHDFGTEDCCEVPNKKCNYWNYNFGYPGSIEDIFKNWGIQSRGNGGSLTPEKIKAEVDAGRPFIIRWALNPSGGHFIVGHGIVDSMVYFMDPWRGEGYKIAKYSAVYSNSSHTWQGTNVISTNKTPTGVIVANRTVPTVTRIQSTSNGLIVTYTVPSASPISVGIYSMRGELLHTIISGFHHSGTYSRSVENTNLATGIYLLSIYNGKSRASTLMPIEQGR